MTVVVELTQADGHTESLSVPRALAPDLQFASALFQTERGRQYFSFGARLYSGLLARLERLPWDDIEDRDLVKYMYYQTQEFNSTEAIQEFFSPSLDEWTNLELASPGQEATINALRLMAYLSRAVRREEFTIERLTREMDLVIFWLLSLEEWATRMARHRIGGILLLVALASEKDYDYFEVPRRSKEWVSAARRPQTINRTWAKIKLKEWDPRMLEEEIRAVALERLARERNRLQREPVIDVFVKGIRGELNFHKMAVKQAIGEEGERRKYAKRDPSSPDPPHESLEHLDPDLLPADRSSPDPLAEITAKSVQNPDYSERLADELIRELSFSKKQGRVVRHILLSDFPKGKKPSKRKIAREARVDRETVKATLEKLEANAQIVRQILFS